METLGSQPFDDSNGLLAEEEQEDEVPPLHEDEKEGVRRLALANKQEHVMTVGAHRNDIKALVTGLVTRGYSRKRGQKRLRDGFLRRSFDTEESLYDNLLRTDNAARKSDGNLVMTRNLVDDLARGGSTGGGKEQPGGGPRVPSQEFRVGWSRTSLCPAGAWPTRPHNTRQTTPRQQGDVATMAPTYLQRAPAAAEEEDDEEITMAGTAGFSSSSGLEVEHLVPVAREDGIEWARVDQALLRPTIHLQAPMVPKAILDLVHRSLRRSCSRMMAEGGGGGGSSSRRHPSGGEEEERGGVEGEEDGEDGGGVAVSDLLRRPGAAGGGVVDAMTAKAILGREAERVADDVLQSVLPHWADCMTATARGGDQAFRAHVEDKARRERRQEQGRRRGGRTDMDLANWWDVLAAAETFGEYYYQACRQQQAPAPPPPPVPLLHPSALLDGRVMHRARARLAAIFDRRRRLSATAAGAASSAPLLEATTSKALAVPPHQRRKRPRKQKVEREQEDEA